MATKQPPPVIAPAAACLKRLVPPSVKALSYLNNATGGALVPPPARGYSSAESTHQPNPPPKTHKEPEDRSLFMDAGAKAMGRFFRPENYDKVRELPDGRELWAGANDWEAGWSWAWVQSPDAAEPDEWIEVGHEGCPGCGGHNSNGGEFPAGDDKKCQEFAAGRVEKWARRTGAKAMGAPKVKRPAPCKPGERSDEVGCLPEAELKRRRRNTTRPRKCRSGERSDETGCVTFEGKRNLGKLKAPVVPAKKPGVGAGGAEENVLEIQDFYGEGKTVVLHISGNGAKFRVTEHWDSGGVLNLKVEPAADNEA